MQFGIPNPVYQHRLAASPLLIQVNSVCSVKHTSASTHRITAPFASQAHTVMTHKTTVIPAKWNPPLPSLGNATFPLAQTGFDFLVASVKFFLLSWLQLQCQACVMLMYDIRCTVCNSLWHNQNNLGTFLALSTPNHKTRSHSFSVHFVLWAVMPLLPFLLLMLLVGRNRKRAPHSLPAFCTCSLHAFDRCRALVKGSDCSTCEQMVALAWPMRRGRPGAAEGLTSSQYRPGKGLAAQQEVCLSK